MSADPDALLTFATGFDWHAGDAPKVGARQGVDPGGREQAFFVEPFIVSADAQPSATTPRSDTLGCTRAGRELFLVCTMLGTISRVISARDMN